MGYKIEEKTQEEQKKIAEHWFQKLKEALASPDSPEGKETMAKLNSLVLPGIVNSAQMTETLVKQPMREVSLKELKEILATPWKMIAACYLSNDILIETSQPDGETLIEDVTLSHEAYDAFSQWIDDDLLFTGSVSNSTYQIYDFWREDAYGKQPKELADKALVQGLREECID